MCLSRGGGESIETMLHWLVTKTECSMQEKQYVQAIFMDIQGSFDSTTFAATQHALDSRDVGRTVIRWIVNMLKCRNICLKWQGKSAEASVVKGCSQGGVLSPQLWYMVGDDVLLKLNAMEYTRASMTAFTLAFKMLRISVKR